MWKCTSPEGTAGILRDPPAVPAGLSVLRVLVPNVETLGYYRMSLRDRDLAKYCGYSLGSAPSVIGRGPLRCTLLLALAQGGMRNPGLDGAPTPRYDSAGDVLHPAGRKDDSRRSVAGGTGQGRGVHVRNYFDFAQTEPEGQLPISEQHVGSLDFVSPPMTLSQPYCWTKRTTHDRPHF